MIQSVKIYNRVECCWGRLDNSYVFVSNAPFTGRTFSGIFNDCNVLKVHISSVVSPSDPIILSVNRFGQYVRVQLAGDAPGEFSLAEVEVMGSN